MKKESVIILVLLVVLYLLIFYGIFNYKKPEILGLLNLIALVVLISVTAIYAYFTYKMAEEMKEQRYDTVRPVVDFELMESYPVLIHKEKLTVEEQKEADLRFFPGCKLRNIGIGPATDVHSFTLTVSGERRNLYLGSLVKGATTEETVLSTEKRGDCWFLVAYFRDAYSRSFRSSREVDLDVETGKPILGPLRIIVVKEEELP